MGEDERLEESLAGAWVAADVVGLRPDYRALLVAVDGLGHGPSDGGGGGALIQAAQDAAELVAVEYEETPAITDAREADKPGAPQVFPEIPGNLAIDWPGTIDDRGANAGEVERILTTAPHVARVSVRNQRVVVATMETRGATASYDATADNLKVDTGLDLGQMVKLARHFKDFTGEQLRSRTLPVYPDTTNGGASVLKLDTIRADPILDVFRGDDAADDVPLPDVRLVIENGSGVTGQAGRAEAAFESLGFVVERTGTATTERATTIIRHAPGAGDAARQVAEFLSPGAQLQEDAALAADHLVIVTGDDFEAVVQDGELYGILSIGDIVKAHHDELEMHNFHMRSYIQGGASSIAAPLEQ